MAESIISRRHLREYRNILSGKTQLSKQTQQPTLANTSDQVEISNKDVIIIPRKDKFASPTREIIKSAKDVVRDAGGKVKKSLIDNGGFLAKVDQNTRKVLESQGYAILENVFVKVVPDYPPFGAGSPVADFGNPPQRGTVSVQNTDEPTLENKTNYTGKGLTAAIIDSGAYPHPDIKDKIVRFMDISKGKPVIYTGKDAQESSYDEHGHGSDTAGITAGSGKLSGGKFKGTAPDANLAIYKVIGQSGGTTTFNVIDRLTRCLKDIEQNKESLRIGAVNMSLGLTEYNPDINPIWYAIKSLTEKGVNVSVSAGNYGMKKTFDGMGAGTIDTIIPANVKYAFTVGSCFDNGTPELKDDLISPFSSHAGKDCPDKPDIIYKGEHVMSINAPDSVYEKMIKDRLTNPKFAALVEEIKNADPEKIKELGKKIALDSHGDISEEFADLPTEQIRRTLLNFFAPIATYGQLDNKGEHFAYSEMNGTSQASPGITGIVLDMLEANPKLTPEQNTAILKETAHKLPDVPSTVQGAGEADVNAALREAEELAQKEN